MAAFAAGHETAQREILVNVRACWCIDFVVQPLLIALVCFERDQRLVLPLAQRYAPNLALDISSIDRAGNDAIGLLVGQSAVARETEAWTVLKEAFHLRL
nr:hypothetical protein [Novosphingobium naphthalenivorans]